jgi:hypothetical protein
MKQKEEQIEEEENLLEREDYEKGITHLGVNNHTVSVGFMKINNKKSHCQFKAKMGKPSKSYSNSTTNYRNSKK